MRSARAAPGREEPPVPHQQGVHLGPGARGRGSHEAAPSGCTVRAYPSRSAAPSRRGHRPRRPPGHGAAGLGDVVEQVADLPDDPVVPAPTPWIAASAAASCRRRRASARPRPAPRRPRGRRVEIRSATLAQPPFRVDRQSRRALAQEDRPGVLDRVDRSGGPAIHTSHSRPRWRRPAGSRRTSPACRCPACAAPRRAPAGRARRRRRRWRGRPRPPPSPGPTPARPGGVGHRQLPVGEKAACRALIRACCSPNRCSSVSPGVSRARRAASACRSWRYRRPRVRPRAGQ